MRGFLACPHCQNRLTASKSQGRKKKYYFYYHCTHCNKARFNTDGVHDAIYQLLKKMNFSASDLKEINKTVRPLCIKAIKNLEIKIELQKNKCSRIEDKYIEELIGKEVYDRHRAKASKKIDILQGNLNRLNAIKIEYPIYLEKVMKILINLSHSYQHSTVSNKVKILKLILADKIIYNGDRITDAPLTELVSFLQKPNKLLAIIESTSGQTKITTDILLAIFDNLYSCYRNKTIYFENGVQIP